MADTAQIEPLDWSHHFGRMGMGGGGLPWKPCQCAKVAPGLLVELVAVSSIGQLLVAFQQLPPSLLIGNRTEITPQRTQHFSVGFLREDVVYSLVLILFFALNRPDY